jgi:iron complex outermembrane receptor protein
MGQHSAAEGGWNHSVTTVNAQNNNDSAREEIHMPKSHNRSTLVALALLGSSFSAAGQAQDSATSAEQMALGLEEVVVTARRREELLQDVPISITVFSQQQLDRNNIVNAGDLATFTPSLSVNQRFGGENTSFAIRGFTQELRTTASVGTYFAEAVAPRGANAQTSGDGAGPGAFFDLENVQVLKGPQGTLFGRNTTGGAVLITPRQPTDELEGYLEGSAGNYDMYRTQGVVNIPASDRVRLRFGVDQQKRDGYLNNITDVGPSDFADVDYFAGRASMVIDITDSLSNYTVGTYSDSETNGQPSTLIACDEANPPKAILGFLYVPDCKAQLARQQAAGQTDFYDVANDLPFAGLTIEQWQIINHTDWEITDDILLKNIMSYANLQTKNAADLFGLDFPQPNGGQRIFGMAGTRPGLDTTNQNSMVEEVQLQGSSLDDTLTWQGGLYYESSEPDGDTGTQNAGQIICDPGTLNTDNPNDFRCDAPFFLSNVAYNLEGVEYDNRAVYTQATYDINDELSITGGARYTWDETKGTAQSTVWGFDSTGVLAAPNTVSERPLVKMKQESDEPTWVTDISYTPSVDILLYGKYSRGYRQGNVNPAGQHPAPGFDDSVRIDIHGPEKVDTYEIGTKTSFEDILPGTFNVAAFYNDFRDQQLQNGIFTTTGNGSTAIVNAGKSRIWGVEVESTVAPTDRLKLSLAYTYLNTEVLELDDVSALIASTGARAATLSTSEGEELPYSPKHHAVASAQYLLPVPAEYGDVTLGTTYVYVSEQLAVSETASPDYFELDSYTLVNFNVNWNRIGGSAFDASLFVTNTFDEEYQVYLAGLWSSAGFESAMTGMPRMFGARIRYNFGALD